MGAVEMGGVQLTTAEQAPGVLPTVMLAGQPVITGGSLSWILTVTFCAARASKLLSLRPWLIVTAMISVLSASNASSTAVTLTTMGTFQLAVVKVTWAG